MLIKTNKTWIDPTTIRAIRPGDGDGCRIYFKRFGDMMHITGITVDELATKVNDALANPMFYED